MRRLAIEELEHRMLLSGITAHTNVALATEPDGTPVPPASSPLVGYLAPAQIRKAYGIDTLISADDDGHGQTIAIIDAYNDPKIVSDVAAFDTQFGLQQFVTFRPRSQVRRCGPIRQCDTRPDRPSTRAEPSERGVR